MSDYFTWNKGELLHFNSHFSSTEGFTCPCSHSDCKEQKISKTLLALLLDIRQKLNAPISVHSGFRCHKHQADLAAGGAETAKGISTHELGDAVDIQAADRPTLEKLCAERFKAIGTARSFLHVDMRTDKVRRWSYLKS